ncbi:Maf family nucleotide pyrophosphatase [Candidatus Pandoraea novymonadis]|uniref:7-methyl-GTP pyrophosphatase n=1 Tax=Candidatus Pandoraea novymonadis TaxID=1808959 RepID=A0ABX5FCX7_9BURK|nr:Maf family nucleotide pyrophosphatase [Candidatus Pandoraea novymonadis]PSB91653.1 Maf-like protein YceF [Candidatus Pandoraea novymonadis]
MLQQTYSLTLGNNPPPLVLASSSQYRRELLGRLQLDFEVCTPNVDETPLTGESATNTSLRLARQKAEFVALKHPDAIVIGSDQIVTLDNHQIGKPISHETAMAQLRMMQAQVVEFHSALCVLDARTKFSQVKDVVTVVKFRDLPESILDAYLHAEMPYDCAGGLKSEAMGIILLEKIESDDPTALIGLPLITLTTMLMNVGIKLPRAKKTTSSISPTIR